MVYQVPNTFQICRVFFNAIFISRYIIFVPYLTYHFAVEIDYVSKHHQVPKGTDRAGQRHCAFFFWHWENILDWRKCGKKWGLEGETKNTVLLEDEGFSYFVTLLNGNISPCMSIPKHVLNGFCSIAKNSFCVIIGLTKFSPALCKRCQIFR